MSVAKVQQLQGDKPTVLPVNYEGIPEMLKAHPQWVIWGHSWDAKKANWIKVPYQANGRKASSTDPCTWCGYEQAEEAHKRGGFDGLGIVLTEVDKLVAVDFDDCLGSAEALAYMAGLNSFTEYSPGGKGFHTWLLGKKPGDKCKIEQPAPGIKCIEVYQQLRYMTVTGHSFPGFPAAISERQTELEALYRLLWPPQEIRLDTVSAGSPLDDERVLQLIMDDPKAAALYTTDCGNDGHSEEDLALCNHLAYYTGGDREQIDRLFRDSELMRGKWDAKRGARTYGSMTIDTAMKSRTNFYTDVQKAFAGPDLDNSEDALALEFATRYERQLRYTPGMDWQHFDGQQWSDDAGLRRMTLSRELCRDTATGLDDRTAKKLKSSSTVNAVVSLARSDRRLMAAADAWDNDMGILNTSGGIVDLSTGSIRATTHNDLVRRMTTVAPVLGPAPNWERFLKQVFLDDAEVINFMQVLLGYCLTGSVREQKIFFLQGKGGGGKSTLIDLVREIMGSYALKLSTSVLMQSKFDNSQANLAELQGVRLATSSEIESGHFWAEARLKELTGDATLAACRKYRDPIEFKQTQKHVVSANDRPRLRGGDAALRQRMVLVPFRASFRGTSSEDKGLDDKLRVEAPAILHWMIQGAVKWFAQGLTIPDPILAASEEYMDAMDDIAEWLDEDCDLVPSGWASIAELYTGFSRWKNKRGEVAPGKQTFTERLRQQTDLVPHKSGARGFRGIRLKCLGPHKGLVASAFQPEPPL